MTKTVRLTNGDVLNFPDEMNDAQIQAVIQREYGAPAPPDPRRDWQYKGSPPPPTTETAQSWAQRTGDAPTNPILRRIDAGFRGAADMLSLGTSDEIAGFLNYVGQRRAGRAATLADSIRAERNRDHADASQVPVSRAAGQLGGALMLPGPKGARPVSGGGAGGGASAARGALAGGAYGSAYGAGSGETPEQRLAGALAGGAGGAALGAGAPVAAQALSSAATRAAANPSSQRVLADRGVRLTVGQAAGGPLKRMEDAATSLPITGSVLDAERRAGLREFNTAVINEGLTPIGGRVPQNVQGRDALADALRQTSSAYDNALSGVRFTPDPQTFASIQQVVQDVPPLARGEVEEVVRDVVMRRAAGQTLDGDTWKAVDSDLGKFIRAAERASQDQGGKNYVADALRQVRLAWRGGLERYDLPTAQAVQNADLARAMLERVNRAYQNSGTAAQGGIATPAQMNTAIRGLEPSDYARGDAMLQDLVQAGVDVLPSRVPDSGTPLRLGVMGAVGGGSAAGGAGLDGVLKALGMDATISATGRAVQAAINQYYRATSPGQAQAALGELARLVGEHPELTPLYESLLRPQVAPATERLSPAGVSP